MPLVIELAFDPVLQLGTLDIRWQTVAVTLALLLALALAARIGSHLPRISSAPVGAADQSRSPLRLDDLAYIVLGIVPGAVAGGRLVHVAVYWDFYAADPARILDTGVGTLSLLGAVVGGTLTGAYVAGLLAAPVRRWADAAALPLLVAIGFGKLAQLLGGSGQGAPFDGPWAVSFLGAGPWHTLNPAIAAHPSQVYEALWVLLGIPVVLALVSPGPDVRRILPARLLRGPRSRPPSGGAAGLLFGASLAWFLLGRVLVGFTWRDEAMAGPLNGEQVAALAVLAAVVLALGWRRTRRTALAPS